MNPVTKAYRPNKEKYQAYVDRIYDNACLTKNGYGQYLADLIGYKNDY